jgi:hypothetical protein
MWLHPRKPGRREYEPKGEYQIEQRSQIMSSMPEGPKSNVPAPRQDGDTLPEAYPY